MPVREALRILEQEGLVEMSARRFTRVAAPSREAADEAYPLLGLLEGFAFQKLPDPASLDEAVRANAALANATSVGARLEADVRFHRAVTAGAGSTTRAILSMLHGRVALLEVRYHRAFSPDQSVAEHDAIIKALRAKDTRTAARVVAKNWQRGHAAILQLLDETGDAP
jgi:DNA-binding GntR family transcriptional regulator